MPYRHSSCCYSGGRHCYTGNLRGTVLWSSTRFLRCLLGTWVMLTTRPIRELWTHVWEEKRLALQPPEQARLLVSPKRATSCTPMPAQGTEDTCPWLERHSVRVEQGRGAEEGNEGGQPGPIPWSPSVGLADGVG